MFTFSSKQDRGDLHLSYNFTALQYFVGVQLNCIPAMQKNKCDNSLVDLGKKQFVASIMELKY